MKIRIAMFGILAFAFVNASIAQVRRSQAPQRPTLPTNMNCEKLAGDKELSSGSAGTILKRGADYYLCRPKSDALLLKARSAAVVVHSTQTISCGDGSSDDCLREDKATEKQIEDIANKTDLWRYFEQSPPSKADLIIEFVANNRASSNSQIMLQVQDSDSGTWTYSELRSVTDIENDVNRLIGHLLTNSGRAAIRSKEEAERVRQCSLVADRIVALQSEYQVKRADYDFKNAHPLDALMDECNLHWKEWVCLKRGGIDGGVSYAKQWEESRDELARKLSLEAEELQNLQQKISTLKSSCPVQSASDVGR
jgi:hypothetical protein